MDKKLETTDNLYTIVQSGGQFVCKGTNDKTLFHFQELKQKYVLSKENLEKIIGDAFDIGTDAHKMRHLPTKKDYIDSII